MSAEPGGSFATLTHARLRAAQGDVGGAVRILRMILEVQPGHPEARGLLTELEGREPVVHKEPAEDPAEAVMPATAGDLAGRFRETLGARRRNASVDRLSQWLERANRNRRTRRVR